MLIRCLLVLHYLVFCCRFLTIPWRYFQLNADYFNRHKKIFSKQDLDDITPKKWRLTQYIDHPSVQPLHYPVFAKPEWGQNSSGVVCIRNQKELDALRVTSHYQHQAYLIQEAAKGNIEFEIFVVKSPLTPSNFAVMSITQVVNDSDDRYPVNGIYNQETHYLDVTAQFSETDKSALWSELSKMGDFRIARFSLKADSLTALLEFDFKLVEVNLFVPMPLSLLCTNLSIKEKYKLLYRTTYNLAHLAQQLNHKEITQGIFFNKLIASYRGPKERIEHNNENTKASNLQVDQ